MSPPGDRFDGDETDSAPHPGDSVGDVWGAPRPAPSAGNAAPHPFVLGVAERYEVGTLLGAGGMGRVFAVHDRLLRREVARKHVAAEAGSSGAARLAREAFITAQLEHPGIVAVYDAGVGPDGVPWYTMRLVRGRTLTATLRETTSLDRLALLRPMLAATQAVAYAHSRGFIHRDLKPDNILVGEFGETQVADWGLATAADGRDAFGSGDGTEPSALEGATTLGAAVGTPAYMSPEQVRGERASKRSDVWALGATLREATTGQAPFSADTGGTLARRRERDGVGWAAERVDGEPELTAILDRAQAQDPLNRYADAGELSDDLARFLDGRRVLAHRYTARDLALRLLRLWRAPLAVGGLATLLLAGVVAVAWIRTNAERGRAVASEADAVGARSLAETHLSEALVAQARTAEASGERARAETLALAALQTGELPAARGVLVAVDSGPRPERLAIGPELGCAAVLPESDGAPALCVIGARVLAHTGDGALLWERTFPLSPLVAAGRDGQRFVWWPRSDLHRLDPASGALSVERPAEPELFVQWIAASPHDDRLLLGRGELWILRDPRVAAEQPLHPCGEGKVALSPLWLDEGLRLLCADDTVAWGREVDGRWEFVRTSLPAAVGKGPGRIAAWGAEGLLVLTDFGRVALLDRTTLAVRATAEVTKHPLVGVVVDAERGVAVLRGDRGDVIAWRPGAPTATPLPTRALAVAVDAHGDLLVYGARRERWRLPPPPPPRRIETIAGLTDIELRPDGAVAVGSRGDGILSVWRLGDGLVREVPVLPGVVIKDATFSPDGQDLLVAAATREGPGLHWLDTSFTPALAWLNSPTRRLVALADGRVLRIDWGPSGPTLVDREAGLPRPLGWPGTFVDLAVSPDRRRVALAAEGGRLVRAALAGSELVREPELLVPGLGRLAVGDDGTVFVAVERAVEVYTAAGQWERTLSAPMDACTSLAISPSGALVAAGDLAGGIFLWDRRSGALLAELRAHASRVSSLAFRVEDELFSASWDATMRRWSLGSLRRPVADVHADLGPWALSVEDALAGRR